MKTPSKGHKLVGNVRKNEQEKGTGRRESAHLKTVQLSGKRKNDGFLKVMWKDFCELWSSESGDEEGELRG